MEKIDKAVEALFEIVRDKEVDEETRAWARQELSNFLKLLSNPPMIFTEPGHVKPWHK